MNGYLYTSMYACPKLQSALPSFFLVYKNRITAHVQYLLPCFLFFHKRWTVCPLPLRTPCLRMIYVILQLLATLILSASLLYQPPAGRG
jgi:hypothetical protein